MAEVFQFGFGDPNNYSDFAKYAGLDRKTGMPEATYLGNGEGVAPPESLSEVWQKKAVDPFNKKIEGIQNQAQNFSNAMTQFGEGNFVKGVNAMKGTSPSSATQATTTSPWNLSVHFGLE